MDNSSDTPDLDELARRYLDLWQEHLSALSRDSDTMETMARTLALMNSGAAAFASASAMTGGGGRTDDGSEQKSEPETARLASEPANADLSQCLERIAALEKRVSELEGEK